MNRKIIIEKVFPERAALVDQGRCPDCGVAIKMEEFRDAVSRAEVGISGLCQVCQDKIFGQGEN